MKLLKLLMAGLLVCCAMSTSAQDYPSRTIKIIVPTAPSSGTDATGRFLADRLAKELKVGVIVENKVGANGIIAADAAAKSPPDGYTVFMGLSAMYINKSLYKTLPFDPVKDFRALLGVNDLYLVMVVPANSPFKTMQDLIAHAKAHPGQLRYASGGSGSTTHLGPALLASMAGIDVVHIPYKGVANSLTDTISGQVDFGFQAIATAAPMIASGRVRALATSGLTRSKRLPDIPTVDESGLKGYVVKSKTFVAVPAGTPDPIAQRLTEAVTKIIRTPEYQTFLDQQGLEAETLTPQEYQRIADEEIKYWAKLVQISGAKVD